MPAHNLSHFYVDLVGPLPISGGHTHLLTVVDLCTHWREAFLLCSTFAAVCAATLFAGWVAQFGVPAVITSDRGAQFMSMLWAALCSLLGLKHIQTIWHTDQRPLDW